MEKTNGFDYETFKSGALADLMSGKPLMGEGGHVYTAIKIIEI